jgi:glutathione S-transferase
MSEHERATRRDGELLSDVRTSGERKMKIYGVPLSVHTRKVIAAARHKQVRFELEVAVPVVPDTLPRDWRRISPTGLIPVIEDNGFRLADSTAILHYLERKHPEPALLPTDNEALGASLFLDAWAGSELFRKVVHPIFHNQVVNPSIRKVPADQAAIDLAMNEAAPEAFGYLEGLSPADFLVGKSLTVADLAVVSSLVNFHYLGRRIDARFSKLNAYFRRQIDSPLINSLLAEEKPFVDQMALDRSFVG